MINLIWPKFKQRNSPVVIVKLFTPPLTTQVVQATYQLTDLLLTLPLIITLELLIGRLDTLMTIRRRALEGAAREEADK